MLTTSNIILAITTVTTALTAGLLFGYSCSVNPGLAKLSDSEYIAAMQSINRVIQNPIFFTCFFGNLVLLPYCAYLHYGQPVPMKFSLLVAATIIYAVTVIGITIFGNVPLNESLDKFDADGASQAVRAVERVKFERPWNYLHSIRTIFSILTLALLVITCLWNDIKK